MFQAYIALREPRGQIPGVISLIALIFCLEENLVPPTTTLSRFNGEIALEGVSGCKCVSATVTLALNGSCCDEPQNTLTFFL
jgi:hypothetical protein